MKILILIIKVLRKFLKSIGKKEKKAISIINYLSWKERSDNFDLNFDFEEIKKDKDYFKKKNLWPSKIAACIAFSYKEERLIHIKEICKNLEMIDKNIDLTIVVNDLGFSKKDFIEKEINSICSLKIEFFNPKDLLDPRLLPLSHFEIVKKKFNQKEYSHFLYLEDDILIKELNIKYWVIARASLKKYNLIPSFVRTEINEKDKERYVVDTIKKNSFLLQSKILNKNKSFAFLNLVNFYCGSYFYDRELMSEHLNGPSCSLDFGHGSYNQKYIIPDMQELGLLERASAVLAFKDVPKGFLHRNMVPVNVITKQLEEYCLIEHLSNKFANTKSDFGKIKVKDVFK